MKKILPGVFLLLVNVFLFSCHKNHLNQPSLTGSVVFWTPNLAAHGGYVDVTINGRTRTITTNWSFPPPDCQSTNGVAYFNLDSGTYSFTTVDFFGFTSSGSVTFVANDCNKKRIE